MILVVDDTSWRTTRYDTHPDGTPRTMTPVGVMLHSDEGNRKGSLPWLTTHPDSKVSCHYYVCRNGDVFQLAEDTWYTWHGGAGTYDGITNMNRFIGIECEHKKSQDWPPLQLDTLAELCRILIARHQFPESRIIAHRWTKRPPTATKKTDPTDFTDSALKVFIAGLYTPAEPDWQVLWGTDFPYRPTHGFPSTWRALYRAGKPIGKPLSDEHTFLGKQVQLFEFAILTWTPADGVKIWRGEF